MTDPPTLEQMLARKGLNQAWEGDMVAFKYGGTAQWEEDWEWDDVARESRGIVFDSTSKKCICLPFRKFFNVGEQQCNADLSSSHLTEKLDGTCILAYLTPGGELALKTLGGFSNDFTRQAFPLLRKAFEAPKNLRILRTDTAIFELLSEIAGSGVIRHTGEPEIVFLGLREIQTGRLAPRSALKLLSKRLGVKLVNIVDLTAEAALQEAGGEWDGNSEGWVGIDAQQRLFKIKYQEYVKLHRLAGHTKSTTRYFELALALIDSHPDLAARLYPVDDITAALNQEIDRIDDFVAPLLGIDWKSMDRTKKKAELSGIPREVHPLIFCGSKTRRSAIARAMAISNLDRARHSSSSTD